MYLNKNVKVFTDEALSEEISFAEAYLRQYPSSKTLMQRWLFKCRDELSRREVIRSVCGERYAA